MTQLRFRSPACIATITLGFVFMIHSPARAQLIDYVRRPDPAFRWQHLQTEKVERGEIYKLHFVSQAWEGIRWQHQLQVYEPKDLKYPDVVLLYVTGGHASKYGVDQGLTMAEHAGMRVAILYQIPNQPLFGGRKEDALIAYTFVRYLHTGDASWPLLFPMVKSVIKAMDVLQAFAPKGWGRPIDKFVITGASKRGWTTWLTAAAGDPRVVAIAPMAIDTLDIPVQMKHQLAVYGTYSEEIDDYVNAGLLKRAVVDSSAGRRLWGMVDPYTYRQHLTLPKLMARGTNDPYWAQDALNLYWNGLRDGKWVLYVPNYGHDIEGTLEDHTRLVDTLGAFARHIASSTPMPRPSWVYTREARKVRLTIRPGQQSEAARLWFARSASLDFRKSHWGSLPMRRVGSEFEGEYPQSLEENVALFGEMDYAFEGQPYTLSTEIHIVHGKIRDRRESLRPGKVFPQRA
jgi:PhoPQ-activated pathogenicity-related protein